MTDDRRATPDESRDDGAATEASESGSPPPVAVDTGVPWGLVLFLVLSVLLAVFAVQNTQDVELQFLGWRGEFPLIMIVVGVFALGVMLDEILGTVLRRRRRRRIAERRELAELRKRR